jgi:hypothetical protein
VQRILNLQYLKRLDNLKIKTFLKNRYLNFKNQTSLAVNADNVASNAADELYVQNSGNNSFEAGFFVSYQPPKSITFDNR